MPSCDGRHLVGYHKYQSRFLAKLVREIEKRASVTRFRRQLGGSHHAMEMRHQKLIPMRMQSSQFQKLGAEDSLILGFPGKCEGVTAGICRTRLQPPKIRGFGSQPQIVGVLLLDLEESKLAPTNKIILIRHIFNVQRNATASIRTWLILGLQVQEKVSSGSTASCQWR